MMKKIGIVLRPDKNDINRNVLKINNSIRSILSEYDVLLIGIVPKSNGNYLKENVSTDIKSLTEVLDLCDGIILPGGYGPFDYDYEIVKYCYIKDKPILGICLGMQVMGELLGGKVTRVNNPKLHNNKKVLHQVNIKNNTLLKNIINKNNIFVNTRHKDTIIDINTEYVNAKYYNVIEGVEDNSKKYFLGVQWHPEDLNDDVSKRIFDRFIEVIGDD